MFRNYLRVAYRNLWKQKAYSFINIAGLAIGLTCSTLILLYLQHEFSYDRHHRKAERIHRVLASFRQENGDVAYHYAANGPVGPALVEEIPEVEDATRFIGRRVNVSVGTQEGTNSHVIVVDDRFFHVFDFQTIKGDPMRDLATPFSAFATKRLAVRLFGDAPALGKTVFLKSKFFEDTYTITGILEDPPQTSTPGLSPDFITMTRPKKDPARMHSMWETWGGWLITQTYVLLKPGASSASVRSKLPDFALRHWREGSRKGIEMTPLTELYLQGRQRYGLAVEGDLNTCYALAAIGLLIVGVACVNFMNLATARSIRRMREVGMRRVVGAQQRQLVVQFMGESILVTVLAFAAALGIIKLALPGANALMGTSLSIGMDTLPLLFAFALGVGIIAGSYPALFISSFSPISALKPIRGVVSGHGAVRRGLVVLQFTVTITLIVATLVIVEQTSYMTSADPGYNRNALLVFPRINKVGRRVKERLLQVPGVKGVSLQHLPLVAAEPRSRYDDVVSIRSAGIDKEILLPYLYTDEDFFEVYEIPVIEGRTFAATDVQTVDDEWGTTRVMLNQTGAKLLGIRSGDTVRFWGATWEVIGIFADFHYENFRVSIGPLVLIPAIYDEQVYVSMRIVGIDIQDVLSRTKAAWKTADPTRPFVYQFLDDALAAVYAKERLLGRLCSLSAGLAIAIACLGLLGLISYTAEVRTKEIGIRKVLGATETGIVSLLAREFLMLVMLASLIAYPMAYYTLNSWLENFAYRIDQSPIHFIGSTGAALVVTLITIAYQALKAARANPIDALRYE